MDCGLWIVDCGRMLTNSDIEHIWQMSWRTSFYRGGPVMMSALSGIDIALWDLKGGHTFRSPGSLCSPY